MRKSRRVIVALPTDEHAAHVLGLCSPDAELKRERPDRTRFRGANLQRLHAPPTPTDRRPSRAVSHDTRSRGRAGLPRHRSRPGGLEMWIQSTTFLSQSSHVSSFVQPPAEFEIRLAGHHGSLSSPPPGFPISFRTQYHSPSIRLSGIAVLPSQFYPVGPAKAPAMLQDLRQAIFPRVPRPQLMAVRAIDLCWARDHVASLQLEPTHTLRAQYLPSTCWPVAQRQGRPTETINTTSGRGIRSPTL